MKRDKNGNFGEAIIGTPCKTCKGPCKVPMWVIYAGGQNYQNAPEKQSLAISRAHRWYTKEWKDGIRKQRGGK